jgi:RNA polymerase sigma-70 factor (ECF subfamily)
LEASVRQPPTTSGPEHPDIDLGACLGGDKAAWDAFVGRYAGVIHSAIRRAVGGRPGVDLDAGDLAQEVFLRLLKDDRRLLRSFDPQRASLSTWLSLVARSMAVDHLRRRRPGSVALEPDARAAGGAGAGAGAGGTEAAGPGIDEAGLPWHLLTARQRLVLRMLFDQQMTVGRAAALLCVDEQTVRSTKHKALSRLREALREGYTGIGDRKGTCEVS